MNNDDIAGLYDRIKLAENQIRELQHGRPADAGESHDVATGVVEVEDLQGWVDNTLCPMLTEIVHPSDYPPWCTEWHQHPLASFLFETAHMSWCEIEDTKTRTKWMGDVLLPIRSVICTPDGPFKLCKEQHHGRAIHEEPHSEGPHRPEVTRGGTNLAAVVASSDNQPPNNTAHSVFTAAVEPVTTGRVRACSIDDLKAQPEKLG